MSLACWVIEQLVGIVARRSREPLVASVTSKILTRVVDAKDANGDQHRHSFENPEQPLVSEGITVNSLCELGNSVDGSQLFPSSAFSVRSALCSIRGITNQD